MHATARAIGQIPSGLASALASAERQPSRARAFFHTSTIVLQDSLGLTPLEGRE